MQDTGVHELDTPCGRHSLCAAIHATVPRFAIPEGEADFARVLEMTRGTGIKLLIEMHGNTIHPSASASYHSAMSPTSGTGKTSVIDGDRKRSGRFCLLGSVSPSLVRQVSESLAGGVGMVELTPFLYPEVMHQVGGLDALWLHGGYPDACLEPEPVRRQRWLEQ